MILTDGKIALGKTKAWFGPNAVELTKDTVYTHPTSKQCNYSVDLTQYATKEGLEKLKGMIDVGAKLVATRLFEVRGDRKGVKPSMSCAGIDFDYVDLVQPSFCGLTPCSCMISKNGSGAFMYLLRDGTYQYYAKPMTVSVTADTITGSDVLLYDSVNSSDNKDEMVTCTVNFYKYAK